MENDGRGRATHVRVGERAYRQLADRLVDGVVVGDDHPTMPGNADVLSRASHLARDGDFLGALRVLGDVQVDVDAPYDGQLQPEDVEQALGDLRRALVKAPAGKERDASARLLEAARVEASQGQWLAAWDLIEEADERLAAAHFR
jgi:hypothetical protein